MTDSIHKKIAFQVETERVLELLSKEIYDSPLAMLRENVQNAYDATLMRCTLENADVKSSTIVIKSEPYKISITDSGIGMSEETLRNNFWKAGSSGKRTELAKKSGVIGTFGIGAMANFGVCKSLRVETRSLDSENTLVSSAEKSKLSISEDCIELEILNDNREFGTTVIAELDESNPIDVISAKNYILPYVSYLPVQVFFNGELISQKSYVTEFRGMLSHDINEQAWTLGRFQASIKVSLTSNFQAYAHVSKISFQNVPVAGEMILGQGHGQLMGLRNYFGLAPVPVIGNYQLGGYANLSFLQPTAGREALSRESISQINELINLTESVVSKSIAMSEAADRNSAFQQYVVQHNLIELADNVTIEVLPERKDIPLKDVRAHCEGKQVHYYMGKDPSILQTFASEESYLLHVSQTAPRRTLQQRYLTSRLGIAAVPDQATVIREYRPSELLIEEASFLARIAATLSDDYLLPDISLTFADISHGVAVLVSKESDVVRIWLNRNASALKPVLVTYRTAIEVFGGFVKDFVRNHLYQRLSQFVPSSTREGVDALAKILQRNRELYRYEENEFGDIEPLLADYLAGEKSLGEIITTAKSAARPQTQRVSKEQMGSLEEALPGVADSPSEPDEDRTGQEYDASPSIVREDLPCDLKILSTSAKYSQLHGFELFLGLSDRLKRREGDFFRYPHTTKVIWGGHRVVYIFTIATGEITLYYDIELREPLDERTASGKMLPTTTLVLKNRIYIPIPSELESAFRIVEGAKEFYVPFDTIMTKNP